MDNLKMAWNNGISGSKAMAIEVISLMPMRTLIIYQYNHGTSFLETISLLYSQGGLKRFYSGLVPALISGPLSRFTDTSINTFVLDYFSKYSLPIFLKTAIVSIASGMIKILLTPFDTWQAMYQVQGLRGRHILLWKLKHIGVSALFHGASAQFLSSIFSNYPWYVTHNYLYKYFYPPHPRTSPGSSCTNTKGYTIKGIVTDAFIGFFASVNSDIISNSMKVVKTAKQTCAEECSYRELIMRIIKKDGLRGLFFRGINASIISNGLQGLMFNVLWKHFAQEKEIETF